MTESNWAAQRERIRSGETPIECRFLDDTAIPGTFVVLACVPEMPMPMGLLWWRYRDKLTLEIVDCYVGKEVRRAGIFREMLTALRERVPGCPRVWTWEGSPHSGLAAIKALGFKPAERGWLLKGRLRGDRSSNAKTRK